mmetsp:Transcript_19731/g.56738  ORF Transcript_19731/g.56738 Transcript_19731/m.56738 type:complete len:334 (+) Transcript_19731:683-1684(+)
MIADQIRCHLTHIRLRQTAGHTTSHERTKYQTVRWLAIAIQAKNIRRSIGCEPSQRRRPQEHKRLQRALRQALNQPNPRDVGVRHDRLERTRHVPTDALHAWHVAAVVLSPHGRHQHQSDRRARHGTLERSHRTKPHRQELRQKARRNRRQVAQDHRVAQDRLQLLLGVASAAVLRHQPALKDGKQQIRCDATDHAAHNQTIKVGKLFQPIDEHLQRAVQHGRLLPTDLVHERADEGRGDGTSQKAQAVQRGDGVAVSLVQDVQVGALKTIGQHDGNVDDEVVDPEGREGHDLFIPRLAFILGGGIVVIRLRYCCSLGRCSGDLPPTVTAATT